MGVILWVSVFLTVGLRARHDTAESINLQGEDQNLEAYVEKVYGTNETVLEGGMNSGFETATFALG